ncbi:MAG: capsid cement protein [Desulfobacteraceae bacterium]|jgi:hypothetical protein|nr:capsid cement protein [Desulfobacteraceae bacterium]
MAYEVGGGIDISLLAAEDLSSYQYRFITIASDTTVQLANGATEYPIGILQNAPESGEVAVVRVVGISKLIANAAITVGTRVKMEYVSTSDNGKADAADTNKDTVRGVALTASGAEDDIITVLLTDEHLVV